MIVSLDYDDESRESLMVKAAMDLGYLVLAGKVDGVELLASSQSREWLDQLALHILHATRSRISKTEYISCPG
ncbi:MAG: 4-hydroxy-3-methylbut-2-en-1-yl diphosphate synthase, partial [Duncaniella sp.]|nr:4-hydroxy-3-methylbut-2-en-1-yl diphosphate synthase [Duncaniella sp.]